VGETGPHLQVQAEELNHNFRQPHRNLNRAHPSGQIQRSMKKADVLLGIVATFSLFFSGCATTAGPKYDNNQQKDSASVAVGQSSGYSPLAEVADVNIYQVDGLEVGPLGWLFNLNRQTRFLDKAGVVWVSPGKHVLVLTFYQNKTPAGSTGTSDVTGSGTIDTEFAANHLYRISASLGSQDKFEVTLWDETSGLATRSSVGHWEFAGWRGAP